MTDKICRRKFVHCAAAAVTLCICDFGFLNFSKFCSIQAAHAAGVSELTAIIQRGKLLVGTTGDYKPMSYLNKGTGDYEGYDVALAKMIAQSMGVEVKFVSTKWQNLTRDTMERKFDIAICGITRTAARMQIMDMSKGYLDFGKTILCRKADASSYKSLADIDKQDVRVMFNPGGTNEAFARANLKNAALIVYPKNEEIPGLVGSGKADIMITETVEAKHYIHEDERLAAPLADAPFTHEQFGILMAKGNNELLTYINSLIDTYEKNGILKQMKKKYMD